MPGIVAIGECMLELRRDGVGWQLGHGGDTFNTALYLARLGERVAYLTALGGDPFSQAMRADWSAEGIDTSLALTASGRLPGLYAVQTDPAGERSFYYWRQAAAVRDLFRLPEIKAALEYAASASLLYLSGITLALFDTDDRRRLAEVAAAVIAQGGEVAFDPNYRPGLWNSPASARLAIETFAPLVTIALPTFEDEAALFEDAEPAATLARWRNAGAREIVVKLGAAGGMIDDGGIVAPIAALTPVDTTGAGDAFNAGYLTARRRGTDPAGAAAFANLLAGRVTGWQGAIMPQSMMPDVDAILRAGVPLAPTTRTTLAN